MSTGARQFGHSHFSLRRVPDVAQLDSLYQLLRRSFPHCATMGIYISPKLSKWGEYGRQSLFVRDDVNLTMGYSVSLFTALLPRVLILRNDRDTLPPMGFRSSPDVS